MEVLGIIAVLAAGLMVGNELAIAVFIHPTLDRLSDNVHLPVASALARLLGRFMPFWYVLVILLTLAEIVIEWHQSGRLPRGLAASGILWLVASVYSITTEVPINNRIASWTKEAPPANWKNFRRRWDLLHRWRMVLLLVALAFLIAGSR